MSVPTFFRFKVPKGQKTQNIGECENKEEGKQNAREVSGRTVIKHLGIRESDSTVKIKATQMKDGEGGDLTKSITQVLVP